MAYWTLATLQAKLRLLTGKPTDNEWATADITMAINNFYQTILPTELMPDDLRGYYVETLNPLDNGTEQITLPDTVLTVSEPMTLDLGVATGVHDPNFFWDPYTDTPDNFFNQLVVSTEPKDFFIIWPNTQVWAADRPYHILLYGRVILFRPPPDGIYTFRAPALKVPTALSGSTDAILRDAWGDYIAYGVATQNLTEDQDTQKVAAFTTPSAAYPKGLYAWAKDKARGLDVQQLGDLDSRPVPHW
jgi:hypothetical protein